MKRFVFRHQPHPTLRTSILAGIGAALAIAFLGAVSSNTSYALLMAPFGASCVLIFGFPSSALAQPANVIGGNFLAAVLGIAAHFMFPGSFMVAGLVVGITISATMIFRIAHPPAGATGIVAYLTAPSWMFLIFPVLAGSVVLVIFGWAYHNMVKVPYPQPLPKNG